MSSNIISIDNVVNVTVSRVTQGLAVKDINSCCIFSQDSLTDGATFSGNYGIYYDAVSVGNDFGTSSTTYRMANAFFSQVPNPLSTNSPLKIYRFDGVNATPKTITTTSLADSIAAFKLVTDGSLTVNETPLTGLDFSEVSTVADIADVIAQKLPEGINLTVIENALQFSTSTIGASSVLTLAAGTTGTDISGADYLNLSSSIVSNGADCSGTRLNTAIADALNEIDFVGVITTQEMDHDTAIYVAEAIETMDIIWMLPIHPLTVEIASDVMLGSLNHTRCLYHDDFDEALMFASAYMGRAFSVNFTGNSTVQDMFLKELYGITPANINQTQLTNILSYGCDTYVNFGGINRTYTSLYNLAFDEVYNLMALKFYMQNAVFNYLATTNNKIPQTEAGMDGIKSVVRGVLEQFVGNGFCAAGEWNSSTTFGDPVVFRKNIQQVGYYIYSLPIAKQTQADREARIAPLIQVAVKSAGSINHITVNVFVEA